MSRPGYEQTRSQMLWRKMAAIQNIVILQINQKCTNSDFCINTYRTAINLSTFNTAHFSIQLADKHRPQN
jgi:hypothetical protein